MRARDWTTIQLVWREHPSLFHARDPFAVAGVVEDPATGAAAAALGGYLRELGLVTPPARVTVIQGEDMGRPGRLDVDIPATGGIAVTGMAGAVLNPRGGPRGGRAGRGPPPPHRPRRPA